MRKEINNSGLDKLVWKKSKRANVFFAPVSQDERVVLVKDDGAIRGIIVKKSSFGSGIYFKSLSEVQEFVNYLTQLLKNKRFKELFDYISTEKDTTKDGFYLF